MLAPSLPRVKGKVEKKALVVIGLPVGASKNSKVSVPRSRTEPVAGTARTAKTAGTEEPNLPKETNLLKEPNHMLLAIDVGNTNTVLGVFEDQKLVAHSRLSTQRFLQP